jgi:hypothetical protein|tara:strand:- start:179 stop:667 length:489 start_codon:yes stop_codon:yes gene_type:complete
MQTNKEVKIDKDKYPETAKKAEYEITQERMKKLKKEIEVELDKKDYLLTVVQTGDSVMSGGDHARQVVPRRYYTHASLREIPQVISNMTRPFWQSKSNSLKDDLSNADEIDFEDKLWGINTRLVIEPLSKELEESYLDGSKKGFFETHRIMLAHEQKKESAN